MVSVVATTASMTKIRNPDKEMNNPTPMYLRIIELAENSPFNVTIMIDVAIDDKTHSIILLTTNNS